MRHGKFKEAEALFDQVLKRSMALLPTGHPETANIRVEQARMFLGQGQADRAVAILGDVLELLRDKLPPEHGKTLAAQEMLAKAHMLKEEFDRAESLLLEVLESDLVSASRTTPRSRSISYARPALPSHGKTDGGRTASGGRQRDLPSEIPSGLFPSAQE